MMKLNLVACCSQIVVFEFCQLTAWILSDAPRYSLLHLLNNPAPHEASRGCCGALT